MGTRPAIRRLAAALLAGVCLAAPAGAVADVTISVASENPASGVEVYGCCGDLCVQVVLPTPVDLLCVEGSTVTLSAPPDVAGRAFLTWRLDGAPFGDGAGIAFPADAPHTATVVYEPPPAPDFIVTGVVLTPPSPTAGYTFRASATVSNVGDAPGDAGDLCLALNAAGDLPCDCLGSSRQAVGVLAPGESRTVAFAGLHAGAAGTKILRAFADGLCATAEGAENNNQRPQAYDVVARAVSALQAATLDGRAVEIGHTMDLEGNEAGTTAFTHYFAEGAAITVTAPATSPDGGVFQKWAENGYPVSSDRALPLGLAASRSLTAVYVGPGEPDFAVTSVVLTPSSPEPGGVFSAAVTVENRGTGAGVPRILDVFLDRPAPAVCGLWGGRERVYGAMAPGASHTYTYTGLPAGASGAKVFRAVIDNTCLTDEPDESDNQGTAAYHVNARPRLDPLADLAGSEGDEIALAVAATDDDGDPVTLAAENLPAGATFDAASGLFRWRPGFDQAGRHEGLTFVATDPWGAWDAATIAIDVADPPGPVFADDFADAGPAGDADWTVISGAWRGRLGRYRAEARRRFNHAAVAALDPLALPIGAGVIRARVRLPATAASRLGPNALLVFARQDEARFRWVRIRRGRVQIGQTGEVGGASPGLLATAPARTTPGRWYRYRVEMRPDGCAAVFRGRGPAPLLGHCFAEPGGAPSLVPGGVGLAASRSGTAFDDVAVWDDSAFAAP